MGKSERQTHDFMNVDSFSQLPFIRPPPPPKEKAIRLFGIEFGDAPLNSTDNESESTTTNNPFQLHCNNKGNNIDTENSESRRRFECHYCCRNFPTSQALGGHQNAHKRERQKAKRAQLQSATVHSSLFGTQVYGLMNYRFGGSATTTTAMSYPTWNSNSLRSSAVIGSNNGRGRFYGSIGHGSSYSRHQQQPINGSPLALWRDAVHSNPSFNRERSLHPMPLFSSEEMNTGLGGSRASLSAGSQNRYVYDSKASVNDRVSLDLHL